MSDPESSMFERNENALREKKPASEKSLASKPNSHLRLQFQFAALACIGGLVLSSGHGAQDIAVIAVFSSLFGFVFVDWLRISHLPAIGAYIAMGAAAVYCVGDFWAIPQRSDQQMVSVARLLVLVQAVLMVQKKSRRIFEQIGVFCLLELVVAAIFNDAIAYGMLLIPTGFVGLWALSLLGITTSLEEINGGPVGFAARPKTSFDQPGKVPASSARTETGTTPPPPTTLVGKLFLSRPLGDKPAPESRIQSWSQSSLQSLGDSSRRWPFFALMTLAPAILMTAIIFFYALPRKIDAGRSVGTGKTLVGFDDKVRLEQLGHMSGNSDTALRVRLTNRENSQPYPLADGLYLRGKVLERYEADTEKSTAVWNSIDSAFVREGRQLPKEYVPIRRGEQSLYDSVHVEISCEQMSRPALFTVAPHFRLTSNDEIVHADERWTLSRGQDNAPFPRIAYEFGTNAFFKGVQTRWIATSANFNRSVDSRFPSIGAAWSGPSRNGAVSSYDRQLLRFDSRTMPTIRELALSLIQQIPDGQRTTSEIARVFETHLATDPRYQYTMNLNNQVVAGVDPIEQFVSSDRRGHCQFFASALAMMLRSIGIPARLVVGYHTNEYSDLGQYFIARQEHAHAWVEALIDESNLPVGLVVSGQPERRHYWMRLDPTPGRGVGAGQGARQVDTVIDLAKNIWEDYVVDMDAQRQSETLEDVGLGDVGFDGSSPSQSSLLRDIRSRLLALSERGGRTEMESTGSSILRLLPIAGIIAGLALLYLGMKRIPLFTGSRRRNHSNASSATGIPTIDFYAFALEQLSRVGIHRERGETPSEVFLRARRALDDVTLDGTLGQLTRLFNRCRYGGKSPDVSGEEIERLLDELSRTIDAKVQVAADSR